MSSIYIFLISHINNTIQYLFLSGLPHLWLFSWQSTAWKLSRLTSDHSLDPNKGLVLLMFCERSRARALGSVCKIWGPLLADHNSELPWLHGGHLLLCPAVPLACWSETAVPRDRCIQKEFSVATVPGCTSEKPSFFLEDLIPGVWGEGLRRFLKVIKNVLGAQNPRFG